MEVWRPWDCECNHINVEEADLVMDIDGNGESRDLNSREIENNEVSNELEEGNPRPVKMVRQHLPLEAKIVARNVYFFFKARHKSEATQIPLSTRSRIVRSNEEDLPRALNPKKSLMCIVRTRLKKRSDLFIVCSIVM